jgi:DNA modification methylase
VDENKSSLYVGDCWEYLRQRAEDFHEEVGPHPSQRPFDTIFADPPDNIGLGYEGYEDKRTQEEYEEFLYDRLWSFAMNAKTVWLSFNAKHIAPVTAIMDGIADGRDMELRLMVQTYTFGMYRESDLGLDFRPMYRLREKDAPRFPDTIRIESWRQKNGDKRAGPHGKVPSDVFRFPRVTGNSKQRRSWHPTQLHEGLVERCLRLTTPGLGTVLDPFAGTGTVARVCDRLGFYCVSCEASSHYADKIQEDLPGVVRV